MLPFPPQPSHLPVRVLIIVTAVVDTVNRRHGRKKKSRSAVRTVSYCTYSTHCFVRQIVRQYSYNVHLTVPLTLAWLSLSAINHGPISHGAITPDNHILEALLAFTKQRIQRREIPQNGKERALLDSVSPSSKLILYKRST